MAYIRPLANGNFRSDVRMKGIVKNKTFPTEPLAQAWADKIESSIKTISTMDQAQLLALSDEQIESTGGEELFKQLGVDLFAVRHAAKLEAINALSKKELLQLTPQEIERMGGAELFIQAGKRIRYKTFREVCNEYLSRWNKKDYQGQMQRVNYWPIFSIQASRLIGRFQIRKLCLATRAALASETPTTVTRPMMRLLADDFQSIPPPPDNLRVVGSGEHRLGRCNDPL